MTGEYSAFVVDDEPGLLRFFEKLLTRHSIAATTFATAEACLEAMRNTNLEHSAVPDLVLIDLDLGSGRMQGHELISRLNNMDVPSELVVMSGMASVAAIEDAINVGAGYYLAKPFDVASLGPTLGRLADIGNGRRTYRMRRSSPPYGVARKRRTRPVFLSYSSPDEKSANFLRKSLEARGIGVWYAPTAIHAGDEFRKQIDSGVDTAQIFIAMLSDAYVASNFCQTELESFLRRTESDSNLRLMPVLLDISAESLAHPLVKRVIERVHYVSFKRMIDCMTVVLGEIELALEARPASPLPRRKRA